MNAIIYIEVSSQRQLDKVWEMLEREVETDGIEGFFTLTVDGQACDIDRHRGDLRKLAESIEGSES